MTKHKNIVIISAALLFLDQFTKQIIVRQQLPHQKNYGLFFANIPTPIIIVLSTILLTLLIIWIKVAYQQKQHLLTTGFLLILIGGLSNFYDRFILGYVIDWIFLPFSPFSVLNLADIYITTGFLLSLFPANKIHYNRR